MTIFVIWQLIVTLDSIRNSCDVFWYTIVYIISICCPLNILSIVARKTNNCVKRKSSLLTCPKDLWLSLLQRRKSALIWKRKVGMASKGGSNLTGNFHQNWVFKNTVRYFHEWLVRIKINSQSLEDTQVGYILQKYTLDKYTLERAFEPSYTFLRSINAFTPIFKKH